MGFTNIDVNHIDIKLVFTDRVSFLQFPFDFFDRTDFWFEIYVTFWVR